MAVNLMAPIQLVHELLPMLLAAEDAHILNVCSIFGLVTWRKTTAYQTSKFGLVGFSKALRAEYSGENFGVTALCPGFVQSSLLDDCETDKADRTVKVPAWICATPEQTAVKAVRAIRNNKGLVLVTPAAHFYWRLMRFSPALVDWLTREGWRRRGKAAASLPYGDQRQPAGSAAESSRSKYVVLSPAKCSLRSLCNAHFARLDPAESKWSYRMLPCSEHDFLSMRRVNDNE